MTLWRNHLLGIDLGAGSLKATIIRRDGSLAGEGSHPVETRTPRVGWSEQDPDEWHRALCRAVPAALAAARIAPGDIAAIGLSGGAHIPVLTDADDRPVRPAIMWNDQRSAAEARELHDQAGELIIRSSLNRVNPTWSLPMPLHIEGLPAHAADRGLGDGLQRRRRRPDGGRPDPELVACACGPDRLADGKPAAGGAAYGCGGRGDGSGGARDGACSGHAGGLRLE
jgi:hypothetical protein